MSKSIEEMIVAYNNEFIFSDEANELIHLSLIHFFKNTATDFYTFSLKIGLDLDDELYLGAFQEVLSYFNGIYLQTTSLFDKWNKKKSLSNHNLVLHFFLYIYKKLYECTKELYSLYIDAPNNNSYEIRLIHIDDLLNGADVITNKIGDALKEYDRIEFADIVVKTNIYKCNKKHKIEQIQAKVEVVNSFGEIIEILCPAGYCQNCNCYFILEEDFERLKKRGIILCQIVSEEIYRTGNSNYSINLKAESVLHQAGYNVSSATNLSDIQRREILKRVVDYELYSISGLCSFLDYLIDKNLQVRRRDMSSAISKWQSDRNFISNYNIEKRRIVQVGSFIEKEYKYTYDSTDDIPF